MAGVFTKVEDGVEAVFGNAKHSHTHIGEGCNHLHPSEHVANRFQSFAPPSIGDIKWFVDGCSYFWAVSESIQRARETIYILDWWLSPELYLRRPPSQNEQYRLDNLLKAAAERGVEVKVIVYREVSAALSLNSSHTKKTLEGLHRNIHVFRHPDHIPTNYNAKAELGKSYKSLKLPDLTKASKNAIKSFYGSQDDVVLYWAHHEKLLVIDESVCFLGGLDLCFGRWDTNSHPIADMHPNNASAVIFPGQDYNNARILDFSGVDKYARMGWSDVAVNLRGAAVKSTVAHFTERWNFIHSLKYLRKDESNPKYCAMASPTALIDSSSTALFSFFGIPGLSRSSSRDTQIQLVRSCGKWSHGHDAEHSIANAYIHCIINAKKFIYIENQFFITACSPDQHPVTNKIGTAIVKRIIRAYGEGASFMVWVVMPAVPAFASDLKSTDALGTRAIMKYQYNSISRGGNSILEKLRAAGIHDTGKYINFYNLRTFDRIRVSQAPSSAFNADEIPPETTASGPGAHDASSNTKLSDHDTVSACYMAGKLELLDIPWAANADQEMEAFVTEELYVHSKLLIADDNVVICGSANLNDRSQLGTHDSEIALVISSGPSVSTIIDGAPSQVSRFASSLRRQISRKHMGLLSDQSWDQPSPNFSPITDCRNDYEWDCADDFLVRDPLSPVFINLWSSTAKSNTEIYRRAFHCVPDNTVRSWADYDEFFSKHFDMPAFKKGSQIPIAKGKTDYGHVVKSEFGGGVEELKAWLGRIRGSLVEMPLDFLVDEEDIAQQSWSLNSLTDELYT